MENYQQNFLASLQGGLQLGQQLRGVQDRNRLNQLASQAYSAPPEQRDGLLGQMAGVDARAAQQQEQAFANTDERRNMTMVNMAKLLTSAPEQARAGLYQRMVPTLSGMGLSELPQEYNAQTAPIIDQAAQSIVQAYGGAAGQAPTDVRSFQMMTQGLDPADVERARRVSLGLDPRQSSAAISYQKVRGPDGIERLVAVDPRQIGAQVVGDGIGYGSFSEAPQQSAPQGAGHFAAFSQLATEFPAVTMTSGARSAERNAQVGGQPNSQHLNGTAADYAVPANQKPAFISRARQLGYHAIDEGDHIHLQLPRGGGGGGANMFAGRRPEDEAAAVEAAKLNTQQAFLPQELEARTNAAIAQSAGIEQNKANVERASGARAKSAQLNNVDRGLSRIDAAMKGLQGRFVDTGPIDGRLIVSTPQGQELEAAVGAIQNDMLALTRVPGVGSQSDLEQKIANLKYPSIYNAPEVNARNVQQLKQFMGDLRRQIEGAPVQPASAAAGPQPGAVEDGYRFRGGNPSDPSSWERI
jgi:hypothetical protein